MPFQKIIIPETLKVRSDGTLQFTVSYESDDSTVSGLSSRLHFDSTVLKLVELPSIYYGSLLLPNSLNDIDYLSREDSVDLDQNPNTDKLFLAAWSDSFQTWPGQTNIDLYTIKFQVQNGVDLNNFSTVINFTGNGANGFTLDLPTNVPVNFTQNPVTFTLDIDGDGIISPNTDAFLIQQYLTSQDFGVTLNENDINGLFNSNGDRNDLFSINDYLANLYDNLDIDGNGWINSITDGNLIHLYLRLKSFDLELTSNNIIGVFDPTGTRTTITEITAYLDSLVGDGTIGTVGGNNGTQSLIIPETITINGDRTFEITVSYESTDSTPFLSAGLYFDSSILQYQGSSSSISGNVSHFIQGPYLDSTNFDQNSVTDQLVFANWSSPLSSWPGQTPIDLYTVKFKIADGVDLTALDLNNTIKFVAQGSQGFNVEVPNSINFKDVNEIPLNTAPVVGNTKVTIEENAATGTFVTNVNVTDDQAIDTLSIQLISGNTDVDGDGNSAFKVQFSNGAWQVVVNDQGDLDFEKTPKFDLTIKATDAEGLFDEGLVTVNLNDVSEGTGSLDDNLVGTDKNDTLDGGDGDDNIIGTGGNDLLKGGTGEDILIGGVGNDLLNGGRDNDVMIGGLGNDTYIVDSLEDIIIERAKSGTDLVKSSLNYTLGNNLENLTLTGTKDLMGIGNNLNNIITGNAVNNILRGEGGNDKLLGGLGNDTLIGGLGKDTLTGGTGLDRFTFESVNQSLDIITDFNSKEDKIAIKASGFQAGLQTGKLSSDKFVSGGVGTVANTGDQRFIYNNDGALYFDPDGNGSTPQTQIAIFNNISVLSNSNFVII